MATKASQNTLSEIRKGLHSLGWDLLVYPCDDHKVMNGRLFIGTPGWIEAVTNFANGLDSNGQSKVAVRSCSLIGTSLDKEDLFKAPESLRNPTASQESPPG